MPRGGAVILRNVALRAELGIDIGAIFKKTRAVFSIKSQGDSAYESDLSGPIIFILGLGSSHMLVRDTPTRRESRAPSLR